MVRTVLFSDVVGSTKLVEQVGDQHWAAVLGELEILVTGSAAQFGGQLVKSLGDGHLVVFEDAGAAVGFAVALQREMLGRSVLELPIVLRMGLHTGEVVLRGGDVHGRAVHVASRVAGLADAGEILVSAAVRDAVGPGARDGFGPPTAVALKGLDGLFDVSALHWDGVAEARSATAERLTLVDREYERRRLDVALRSALDGSGAVALLEGVPGIGKSSLMHIAAERAAATGLTVLRARGDELEADYAFGVVRQLLEPVVQGGDPSDLLDGEARFAGAILGLGESVAGPDDGHRERRALLTVCLRLAEQHPLAILVDDAHWADLPSLRWLALLAAHVLGRRTAVLVAARPGQPGEHGELLTRLAAQTGADHVTPRALSTDAVRALITRRLGPPDPVFVAGAHAATGGNPFLVGELTRSMQDAGAQPRGEHAEEILLRHGHGLGRVVLARVAALGREGRALAEAAAIFPTGSPLRHAAALAQLDLQAAGAAADALTMAGVFAAGRPLRFVHPLTRTSIYEEIATARRADLHRAAAFMLRDEGEPVQDVAAQIMLAEPAADPAAVHVLRDAAKRARDIGALDIAARYLQRALLEPPPAAERTEVRRDLGEAQHKLGDHEAAIATLTPVLAAETDPALRIAMLDILAQAHGDGLQQRATAHALVTAELARHEDPASDEHLLLEARAAYHAWAWANQPCDPHELADAVQRIRGPGSGAAAVLEGHAWNLAATATAPVGDVLALAERALECDPDVALIELYGECERDDLARGQIERKRTRAEAEGDISGMAFADRMLAESELTFDLRAAEAHARRAEASTEGANAEVSATLAWVLILRGAYDEAESLLRARGLLGAPMEAIAARIGSAGVLQGLLNHRARLAAARGDLAAAERDAVCARELKPGVTPLPHVDRLSDVLLRLGRREEARAAAEEVLVPARAFGAPSRLGLALAQHARCLPDADEALDELGEAARHLQAGRGRYHEAEGLLALGEVLRRAGRRNEARTALAQARATAEKCGAQPLADRAAEEQRLAGARPRRVAVDGVDALTASEARVAALAAEGRTNAEIAGELVLSVRTIEMHLGRTYRKLGIKGRADLPAALGTHAR
jgi:class 3 adenylate cyclase/DNA-binding CsgD family transcriptional regulator